MTGGQSGAEPDPRDGWKARVPPGVAGRRRPADAWTRSCLAPGFSSSSRVRIRPPPAGCRVGTTLLGCRYEQPGTAPAVRISGALAVAAAVGRCGRGGRCGAVRGRRRRVERGLASARCQVGRDRGGRVGVPARPAGPPAGRAGRCAGRASGQRAGAGPLPGLGSRADRARGDLRRGRVRRQCAVHRRGPGRLRHRDGAGRAGRPGRRGHTVDADRAQPAAGGRPDRAAVPEPGGARPPAFGAGRMGPCTPGGGGHRRGAAPDRPRTARHHQPRAGRHGAAGRRSGSGARPRTSQGAAGRACDPGDRAGRDRRDGPAGGAAPRR